MGHENQLLAINWTIPNLDFTWQKSFFHHFHPFKTGCLGSRVVIMAFWCVWIVLVGRGTWRTSSPKYHILMVKQPVIGTWPFSKLVRLSKLSWQKTKRPEINQNQTNHDQPHSWQIGGKRWILLPGLFLWCHGASVSHNFHQPITPERHCPEKFPPPTLEALASCPSPVWRGVFALFMTGWPPTLPPPNYPNYPTHQMIRANMTYPSQLTKKPIPQMWGKETDQLPCPNLKSHGSGRPQKLILGWFWHGLEIGGSVLVSFKKTDENYMKSDDTWL